MTYPNNFIELQQIKNGREYLQSIGGEYMLEICALTLFAVCLHPINYHLQRYSLIQGQNIGVENVEGNEKTSIAYTLWKNL